MSMPLIVEELDKIWKKWTGHIMWQWSPFREFSEYEHPSTILEDGRLKTIRTVHIY